MSEVPAGHMLDVSKSMTSAANAMFTIGGDPALTRAPERFFYIFTVSKRAFLIERPPVFPHLVIPACGKGERYKMVCRIPDPFPQAVASIESGRIKAELTDAIFIVTDLVNPANPSTDQNFQPPAQYVTGQGTNYSQQGVFWTLNSTPAEDEIAAAEQRLRRYQEGLIREIQTLERSSPKDLQWAVTVDHHLAYDAFGLEASWHTTFKPKALCPNCGETISEGVAFHKNLELGMICIIDPVRARAAGVSIPKEVKV